jgi:alkylation response protein AidB-like acyl-CoA dehydrogenase
VADLESGLFGLDDEQTRLRDAVRDFAQKEVAPIVEAANREEKFPRELLDRMAELNLFGGVVEEKYGGMGLDHLTYSILIEEMARVDHIAAVYMTMPSSLVGAGLRKFGTEEQKVRWLAPLAQGRIFGAGGVTEPRSGSDVAGLSTTYKRDGDGFVLNGSKAWISNLDHADFMVTFATRDRSLGRDGISAFIIPTDTPGLGLHPYKDKLGFRSICTGDVALEDVRVPAANLLGEEGGGFAVAMGNVEAGRLGVASRALGQAQACLDDSVEYTQTREIFGQTVADFQMTKAKLADLAVGVTTARLLVHAAARQIDAGSRARSALSAAKMYASDVMQRAATEAVQMHGAYGTAPEYRVSRIYRDAKVFQLVEGANEIHRVLIADAILRDNPPGRA